MYPEELAHDDDSAMTPEHVRLSEDVHREKNWKRWGPYLSERQWGTVREDYSSSGDAWRYFPFEHSRSRAYRWGEDGLMGICDRQARLCFAWAFWNEKDPILKERLFGLANGEGPHGEDVKECYWYLDATPTSSYLRALYKYPQRAFPYEKLREEGRRAKPTDREYELADTKIFDDDRYFDITVEYAKGAPEDVLILLTIENRASQPARLHVLPTFWFRNTWSWNTECGKPLLEDDGQGTVMACHSSIGNFLWAAEKPGQLLFTENETNTQRVFGVANSTKYVKDAFHDYVIGGRKDVVNPKKQGTKCASHHIVEVPAEGSVKLRFRLVPHDGEKGVSFRDFNRVMEQRRAEARSYLASKCAKNLSGEEQNIVRQSYAGLLWSKQSYHYHVKTWLAGDPAQPAPPPEHSRGRNADWGHLYCSDIISMPDKWEYPWFAAWDLAFHMIPMARIDPDFAKQQLTLLLREWYMHPNGAIPAYEWNFSDVNPPVHAWACWRVYKITATRGHRDTLFLEKCFQKLLLNFTWWVNRKDARGRHLFGGGFLGMDNIGLFDRSRALPAGETLEQADGTAWMAFYCATMLAMALELAKTRPAYEDIASKFFEHFVAIADAMNTLGGCGLWDDQDGFYYDHLRSGEHDSTTLRVRSMVGLVPLLAVEVLDQDVICSLPGFRKRMRWFLDHRPDLAEQVSYMERTKFNGDEIRLLAIPSRTRLLRVLKRMLDPREFLSPHGIRSMSQCHREQAFCLLGPVEKVCVQYEPGESTDGMWGGNSNWRGPVWFPLNYLLLEALERYHHFYGDTVKVECPTGSGVFMNLAEVSVEIARRNTSMFLRDQNGNRAIYLNDPLEKRFASDPHWKDLIWFHEYFDGDTGRGLGANHQTGWTSLVSRCMNLAARVKAAGGPVR